MNKYLVRYFKWRENLGKVPAKVNRLEWRELGAATCRKIGQAAGD